MSEHTNKVTGSMLKWCDEIRRDFTDLQNELTFETEHVVAMVESNMNNNKSNGNNRCDEKRKSVNVDYGARKVDVADGQNPAAANLYLKQANDKLMSVNDLLERQYRETVEYNRLLEKELSFVQQELKIEKAVRKGLFNAIKDELVILDENLDIVYQNKKLIETHGDCTAKNWKVMFGESFPGLKASEIETMMRGMEQSVLSIQNNSGAIFKITILPIRNLDLSLYTLVMKKELKVAGSKDDSTSVDGEKNNFVKLNLSDVTKIENSKEGSVSHKIRTPLNSILTSARIIQKFNRQKPEAVDKFSQVVVDETYRILDLIKKLPEN